MLSSSAALRVHPITRATRIHSTFSARRYLSITSPRPLPRQPWSSAPRVNPRSAASAPDAQALPTEDRMKDVKASAAGPPESPIDPSDPPLPPSSSSFPDMAVSLISCTEDTSAPLLPEYRPVFQTLSAAFLPANQTLSASSERSAAEARRIRTTSSTPEREPVVALVCPFEGGDHYVSQAVQTVAAHLDAEVLKIDLALALGFDGAGSPMADAGMSAPTIPQDTNPLFRQPNGARSPDQHSPAAMDEEDEDIEDMMGKPNVVSIPMFGVSPGMPMMRGGAGGSKGQSVIEEKWVTFFQRLINLPSPTENDAAAAPRKRILLLESSSAMAETFPIWWPSLLETVKQRRSSNSVSKKVPRKGKSSDSSPLPISPTTIVLSCPPSLLLPHTGDFTGDLPDGPTAVASDIRSTIESALSEKFGGVGISVIGGDKGDSNEEKIWWSSEEGDSQGRLLRDKRRLQGLLDEGPGSLLPAFTSNASRRNVHSTGNPIVDSLLQRTQSSTSSNTESRIAWRTLAILPPARDLSAEHRERVFRRRVVSVALLQKALIDVGGQLEDPLAILRHSESVEKQKRGRRSRATRRRADAITALLQDWDEIVVPWLDAQNLASATVGRIIGTQGAPAHELVSVRWQDILDANLADIDSLNHTEDVIKQHLSVAAIKEAVSASETASPSNNSSDPIIDALKKGKNVSAHEKRLLPCIVETAKLASTSFQDVHLPDKTIDGVRTLVSLPLLYPEAFHGGILRQHATSGALLFGPPGTGKTLLVRAVAKEGGARMLAIQPSDVNDMYVGEGEKLVKAVFSLARKLSPCVIFLDEVDSLFGARASRDASGGAKAHNQVLTEFMQEMDGLSSAISNRDKRIVVIGATNRPFDLDDAILRRLPRRLLVDLPGPEDRLAILKILLRDEVIGEDVDLDRLAKETEGYSGSDLKHLCISAALASLKEVVELPWITKRDSSSATHASSTGNNVTEGSVIDSASKSPSVDIPLVSLPKMSSDNAFNSAKMDSVASPQVTHPPKLASGVEEVAQLQTSENSEPSKDVSLKEEDDKQSEDSQLKRTVYRRHFTTALAEIRPSSTEAGTLPELRRWAEQYGEGGKRQGSKSGFGKGFGFGMEPGNNRESGYGRVTQDD